jgi:hypothetical protein
LGIAHQRGEEKDMKTFNIYGKLGDNGEIKRLAYRVHEKDAVRVANEFYHSGYVSVVMLIAE